jgi:hypothetical protein
VSDGLSGLEGRAGTIQAIGSIVTAVIACAALGIATWQVLEGRNAQREATATQIWRDHMQGAIQNPQLAAPDYCRLKTDAADRTRYEYFVGLMLFAGEEILRLDAKVADWTDIIGREAAQHARYLCADLDWRDDFSGALLSAVDAKVNCKSVAPCAG